MRASTHLSLARLHRPSSATSTRFACSTLAFIERRFPFRPPDKVGPVCEVDIHPEKAEVPHPEQSGSIGIDELHVNSFLAL